jgi:fibronectin type III domain protein
MADSAVDSLTSGTVKLPGVGPVKKQYLFVGIGAVGVLAAYLVWRRQQAAANAVPADAPLDTGLTTGAGSDIYQGANAGGSGSSTGESDITPMPTTNTEWTQQVIDSFTWLEPGFVTSTIGKYLARVPLSSDEADFIRQAWAVRGKPPEGPDNFILSSGTNTPGTTTVPSVPNGLRASTVTASSVGLDWSDSTDATGYQVFRGAAQVGTPSGSSYTDTGLASNTSYSYTVRATNAANISAPSAAVTAKTSVVATPAPKPTPKPAPAPAKKYAVVTVKKYTDHNPPWESTISGIAGHYHKTVAQVWNDPKNFGLRTKRKQMNLIQPGDTVYVPV